MEKEKHQAMEVQMKIKIFSNNFPNVFVDFICLGEFKNAKEDKKFLKAILFKPILLISFKKKICCNLPMEILIHQHFKIRGRIYLKWRRMIWEIVVPLLFDPEINSRSNFLESVGE